MSKVTQPSVDEEAFNCPHCHAFTTQEWFACYGKRITGKNRTPFIAREHHRAKVINDREMQPEERDETLKWMNNLLSGFPLFAERDTNAYSPAIYNLHVSQCYHCHKIAVWVYDRLLFPATKVGVVPNSDLPDEIVRDFEEAREIAPASPRGAAALLRLCIQKLCKHLGEGGKNINDDIANLVKNGLSPRVQQALDIVRVIGNDAVHPGVIDLNDDPETAYRLFDLLNSIADQMISHPKAIDAMYSKLPEDKRKAIEARDKK